MNAARGHLDTDPVVKIPSRALPDFLAAQVASSPTLPWVGTDAAPGSTVPDMAAMFAVGAHTGTRRCEHPCMDVPCGDRSECPVCAGGWSCDDVCDDDECDRCAAELTPRMAYLLHAGASVAGDMVVDTAAAERHGSLEGGALTGVLPTMVLRWLDRQDPATAAGWLADFVAAIDRIAATLASGQVPAPDSPAEEMALHIVCAQAQTWAATFHPVARSMSDPQLDGNWARLPEVDERDVDFSRLGDVLFVDEDVLELFDPIFDEPDDVCDTFGIVITNPAHWFKTFGFSGTFR